MNTIKKLLKHKPKYKMPLVTILILVLVGISAGVLGGLVGVGGGIIIVPSLIYFLNFTQKNAQGTSLGLLLLPVGILGVLQYYKEGYVDLKIVGILSLGFLLGSYFGSKIALSLPQETVKKIFAVLMILISLKMLFFDKPHPEQPTLLPKSQDHTTQNMSPK
ncbi:MAG: sulfite exporter TauE/SafE family protein [Ginsengibacter sp.]